MTENTSFEVQVQRDGQWTIHENFKGHQKEAALEEAINILSNVERVKVVKEVLDPDSGVFNDFIIFKEVNEERIAAAAKRKTIKRTSPRGASGKLAKKAHARQKKPVETESVSLGAFLGRLLMLVLFSLGLAAMVSMGASMFFGGSTVFGVRLVGRVETNFVVGTFIVTFLIAATGLAFAFLRGLRLKKAKHSRLVLWLIGWWAIAQRQAAEKGSRKAVSKRAPEPSPQTLSEAEQKAKDAEDKATAERLQAELEKEKEKEEAAAEESAEEPEAEAEPKPEDSEQAQALSPEAENLKAYMLEFLTQALKGTQADMEKMDSFNKFGVSLYMAGACEIRSQKGNLDALSRSKILADSVQVMGFKKSHAGSFADRYEEYLMADARYMQMFQAGRNAINIYLDEESAGPKLLDNAIAEWNKPKTVEEQSGPVTVLFTDIAGSTAMTQSMGDAGAQKVVRAHNRIVREALSGNAGNEVKHTGDGIMASFTKTANGVDASIQMQREIVIHNQNNPDLPLHLKIGLNAGEPIAEENDLFGTVVQLAARIVDKASADQIFISELVKGLCAGKNYNFISQGGFEMKGFSEDIAIYEVTWKEGGAEGGDAPSPPTAAPGEAPPSVPPTAAPAEEAPPAAPPTAAPAETPQAAPSTAAPQAVPPTAAPAEAPPAAPPTAAPQETPPQPAAGADPAKDNTS